MALTYGFALSSNKVTMTETDTLANVRIFSFNNDYNIIPSNKGGYLLITKNTNNSGVDKDSFEIPVANITGNPTPLVVNDTITWLSTTYFKGLSIADVSIDAAAINLNTDTLEASNDAIQVAVESIDTKTLAKSNKYKLENQADDLVTTLTYLDGGLADQRVSTIVYSSIALALTVTETFAYDGGAGTYRVSTITLS